MVEGLIIEIVGGANSVATRNANDRNGNPIQYFHQDAYAHIGDAFPVKIKIPVDGPALAYSVGKYSLSLSSYRVGRYGDLEINPFSLSLVPLEKSDNK